MKIAFASPFPPLSSGISDYSSELAPRLAECAFHLVLQRGAVEGSSDVGPVGVHRLPLDELAFDGVERRELVMSRFERAERGFDAEQRAQEILEMRPERDQQLGLGLGREGTGFGACRTQTRDERRICGFEMRDEKAVEARRALDRIKVGENEPVRKRQRR